MNLFKLIINTSPAFRSCCFNVVRKYTTATINIPIRIKRNSTDILSALASTVKVDTTGPAFKYQDDPFLTPISSSEKRKFALSKESGRKAARWIRDTHPDCFNHQPDDPVIKSFIPKIQIEEGDVTEQNVRNAIEDCSVSEAINFYKICQSNSIELSKETLQELLELIAYFNGEDGIDPEWKEEILSHNIFTNVRIMKTWKDGGVAEEIFEDIKESGAKPYCAIIQGMCKYYQTDRAWELFQEALAKNLPLSVETYNSIFRVGFMRNDESQERWNFIKKHMELMVKNGISPNLGTLNSILDCMILMRSWNKIASLSLQVIKEFKQLGIEPSLASYYYILRIHQLYKERYSPVVDSILDQIEGKNLTIRDIKDTWFFFSAMEACKTWDLAVRLHNIMLHGDNFRFLGGNHSQSLYYKNFMMRAVDGLSLEEFMNLYDQLVPFVYSPDSDVMEELLRSLGVYDQLDHLPRIWSDIVLLELRRNEKVLEITLMIMNKHQLETVDPVLASQLATVTWDMWERVQKDREDERVRKKVEWTGPMLGDSISVLVRCGATDKAFQILNNVSNNPSIVLWPLPTESLVLLCNSLLKNNMNESAMVVARYAKECEYTEAYDMARSIAQQSSLEDYVKSKLVYSFGVDVL